MIESVARLVNEILEDLVVLRLLFNEGIALKPMRLQELRHRDGHEKNTCSTSRSVAAAGRTRYGSLGAVQPTAVARARGPSTDGHCAALF
jgi:hypothetical protein